MTLSTVIVLAALLVTGTLTLFGQTVIEVVLESPAALVAVSCTRYLVLPE